MGEEEAVVDTVTEAEGKVEAAAGELAAAEAVVEESSDGGRQQTGVACSRFPRFYMYKLFRQNFLYSRRTREPPFTSDLATHALCVWHMG